MGSDAEDIDTPRKRGFGEALRNPMMSAEQWFARPRFTPAVRAGPRVYESRSETT